MAEQETDDFLGTKPLPFWRRRGTLIAVGLGILLLLLLAVQWWGGEAEAGYATAEVTRGDLVSTVSATGKLAPTNQVVVGSQLSGQIIRVLVDVNDPVARGQPLAEIDPEQLDAQIRQNQAQLAANRAAVDQAQATLAQAQAQLARLTEVHRLSNGRVPSQTEMQTGRADVLRGRAAVNVARANVVASEASLAQIQTQRARAVIRSPVSGVVLARQVDPGQTVAASFNTPTLFVIAEDLSRMKLQVSIDEADVGEVKARQKARFTVDAFPGRTFPAAIERVAVGSNLSAQTATASSSTSATASTGQVVSYAADLSVANPTLELRPGMTATADIITSSRRNVLLIPNAAMRFEPSAPAGAQRGQPSGIAGQLTYRPRRGDNSQKSARRSRGAIQRIYVLGQDGEPRPIEIRTGDSDGMRTQVLSGDLKPGMEVITGRLSGGERKGG